MTLRKALIIKTILTVALLQGTVTFAANKGLNTLIDATAEINAAKLDTLALSVETDLPDAANHLQTSLGGRKALQRYASAMLTYGQAERLGRQWAALIADTNRLGKAENKDGSVWYPHAIDAGFFAGGIAAALSQSPQAILTFSSGADLTPPASGQSIEEWFAQALPPVSKPARSAFDQALRAGSVH